MSFAANLAIDLTEQGLVPDAVVRHGIRRLLRERLAELLADDAEAVAAAQSRFVREMDAAPVAVLPDKAYDQHYALPPALFEAVLGARRKYSCCFWPAGTQSLDAAETAALDVTCQRAGLDDGQRILELGCGWGSLSLWMAERYPGAAITAVSNSAAQGAHIRRQAEARGLANLRVLTADMNGFATGERFDRVVSVEMFEHMRNWRELFARIHGWLAPGGRFFMHVFCHRAVPYLFEDRDAGDWMSRHFFSGGMMPSDDLALRFQDRLALVDRWRWNGTHYARTARAWLANMDARRERLWPVLEAAYGPAEAALWWARWRLFFMACEELFGFDGGEQWWVSHYLFERPERTS